MVTAEVSALACEGGCVVGGGEWVCGCERVVVVVVAVEEEWLKSSSAGIKTTGLAERATVHPPENGCPATFQSNMGSGVLSWTERLCRNADRTMHAT
jgi:hypothetical protein